MNEWLRPSTMGEILDRTANLYRSRFLVFFGIASVPAAIVLGFAGAVVLLAAWAGAAAPATSIAAGLGVLALAILGLPAMLGANALSSAAMCHATSSILLGETITISAAFKAVWKRGWHCAGLYVIMALIIGVAPFVAWMALAGGLAIGVALAGRAAAGAGVFPGALMLLAVLALAVYAVWMLLRLCLAFPALVVEQSGVGAALKRASALSRGTRGRILVLFLLCVALSWLASLLLMIPLVVVMALVPAINAPQHAQLAGTVVVIAFYVASFAVQTLIKPVYGIALVLFYYDQRVRREGFDIELLMRRAGMAVEPAAPVQPAPWLPAAPPSAHTESQSVSPPLSPPVTGPAPGTAGGAA